MLFKNLRLTAINNTQYGSNPGGIHVDQHGNKHYVKFYRSGNQAKTEVLTAKIYHHMGIRTLNPEYHNDNGRHAVITRWNDNIQQKRPSFFSSPSRKHANQLGRMFHAAILTKNWDIVGLEHDNIVHNTTRDNLHSVDQGGSFNFRARGSHKEYGPDINDYESLKNTNRPSGHVFNFAFSKHSNAERNGLKAVKRINDEHIHNLFKNSGLDNWQELHNNFVQRKNALLNKYGE